ncbi:hypothetical protein CONLIGDRAFT_637020 [Coniochaeta ligniaria NRRL 30616]|uniref:Uncharacterized protein n=1 Tax=Coniochaeta ligniaria NRRL 30616 TaxID=1408157 RepID=A0A1J7I823_9PEZI|nr:hypothetical protein CONLIGDRAFT_637020 [Coniochaeta ligniaria NRRL 30616]
MDRGRGRGRASNKARRSQFSPNSHSHSHIDHSDSSSFTFSTPTPPPPRHLSPQHPSPNSSSFHTMEPAANNLTPRSERPARSSSLHHSFSFEAANGPASAGYSTRKRTRVFAMGYDGAADDVATEKGGHTLRKRSRVDYTQEVVDDDLLAKESKPDANKKPTPAASAPGRKRRATQDLSGDETDNVSVTQKRRRLDKEPTGPRSTTTRRKTSSKQPSSGVQPSVEHPSSDNEVQDTILVGGAIQGDDADLESSSDDKNETSHGDSPQPPTLAVNGHDLQQTVAEAREVQKPAVKAEQSPTLGSENQISTDAQLVPETPLSPLNSELIESLGWYKKSPAATEDNDGNAEAQQPAHSTKSGTNDHGDPVTESTGPDELPGLEQQPQQISPRPQTEHIADLASLDSSTTKEGEEQALIAKNAGDQEPEPPISTTPVESLEPQVPQPKRLPKLDEIYKSALKQKYHGPLAPYEDEDVVLPASWTEQVHPQETSENGISTPAPTITPRPTPPPKDPAYIADSWDATKPLITKQFFALYREDASRRRSNGQSRISLMEFRSACARHRKEALEKPKPEPEVPKKAAKSKGKAKGKGKGKRARTPASSVEADSPAVPDVQLPQIVAAPVDETPRASPAPESQPVTAAPSPEPEAEPEVEDQQDNDQDVDAEVIDTEDGDGPIEPETVTKHPKKQYLFKKLPDLTPFEEALNDPEEADDDTLYSTLDSSARTLKAWQDEYLHLKKITDDEDNAKRRAQNDKAIENWDLRQKLDDIPAWRRTFDDIVQKIPAPFDVKGVRAPKPYVDDPDQEHQRQEDKIMAQAYGFDLKNDKASIGKQDPIAQRFETSENRLRDRRQTQKAADAAEDGVILEGKRARKPRVLEEQTAPVSRATTPVPVPRQRQRRTAATAAAEDPQPEVAEAMPEPVARKRAPRVKSKASSWEDAPQPDVGQNNINEQFLSDKPKLTRKRIRTTAPHPLATTTYAEPEEQAVVKEEPEPPAKRQRKTKEAASNGPEIPAGSFYSQTATEETGRPSTSSSSGTANTAATVESSYSLRDKRKRNFAAENDPIAETRPKRAKPNPVVSEEKSQEPAKRKRVRQRKKAPAADEKSLPPTPLLPLSAAASPAPAPGMMMHTFSAHPDPIPAAAPAPAKKPLLKIKLINGHSGHNTASPATTAPLPPAAPSPALTPTPADQASANPGSSNGSAEPPEKPYSEMSKSEKMSYSMRRRWAAGEMQGAVEKRKNTLARKAEAKATAPPPDLTPKPLQPAAGPSGHPIVNSQPQLVFQEQYMPPPGPPPQMM